MDALARKLEAAGIAASVHEQGSFLRPYGGVDTIAAAAAAAARGGKRPILVGHSMGADAALKVAVKLSGERIAVPLVVCFDPDQLSSAVWAAAGSGECRTSALLLSEGQSARTRHAESGAWIQRYFDPGAGRYLS
jgi:pimeloyl-ACP methyl ester carboxylesterase